MMKNIVILLLLACLCNAERKCGHVKNNNKIYGGWEAEYTYPWMASLSTSPGFHSCGGSLIDKEWILTAGHCVSPGYNHYVKLGYHDLSYSSEGIEVTISGSGVYRHESYSYPYTYDNDIALLHIEGGVEMSDYVDVICLPTDEMEGMDVEGIPVFITGWGYIEGMTLPDVLYVAEDFGMNRENCQPYYSGYVITNQMMCMKGDYGKQCNGDSGGPVSMIVEGSYVELGIVSFSQKSGGQCFMGYPAVQAFVPNLMQWVKETTGIYSFP